MPKPNYYFFIFYFLFYNDYTCNIQVKLCLCVAVREWMQFMGRCKVNCGPPYTTPSYRGPTKQAWPFLFLPLWLKKRELLRACQALCCACRPWCIFCSVIEILGTFGYSKIHWLYIIYGIMIYGLFCYKFFCFFVFLFFYVSSYRLEYGIKINLYLILVMFRNW